VPNRMAFTGEITLRGQVLPVGGLREKLLAAHRFGIRTAVLPKANRPEQREFPASVTKALNLVWAEDMADVFKVALPGVRQRPARGKKPAKGSNR
jgi:ATP-dependent Lon protease